MAATVHRQLKVIAFNANGIWRRCYELSKQLLNLHIDVALLSETHLKPRERSFIPNYHFYRTERFPGRKGIPHKYVNLCYVYVQCEAYSYETNSSSCQRSFYIRAMTAMGQLQKKKYGRESQGAWPQEELKWH
jgi:hypothetical protein